MSTHPLIDGTREKILSLPEETRFAPNGIVSRTLLHTAHSRVVLFGFAAGQELTEHTSTQHAVIQILSGECELVLAGKPHSLRSGDFIYMPPHLPHAVRATEQCSLLLTLSQTEGVVSPAASTQTPPATMNPPLPVPDAGQVLDVRSIPCSVKHGLIIRQWLDLHVGGHFILLNNHDPVPLRHQFAAQWPGAFTWERLVNEPEVCRVKITKLKAAAPPAEIAECNGDH